jgi:hypothetical protein
MCLQKNQGVLQDILVNYHMAMFKESNSKPIYQMQKASAFLLMAQA